MTSRRGFLLGLTTALATPAVVRAESLMKLWVPPAPVIVLVPDHEGHIYDGREIVGSWAQKSGVIRWKYRNPVQVNPANGIYEMSYEGPFSRASQTLSTIPGVTLWPT